MPKGIFLATAVDEKGYFSSSRSQHFSETRPHAMTPKNNYAAIMTN